MVTRKLIVNGREMTVTLGADGTFQTEERSGAASIVEVEPGVYSVLLDGRSYEVHAQGGSLTIGGERFAIDIEDPRSARRGGGLHLEGRQTITAAMPGKIVRVLVSEGDDVVAGQGMLVIEAMKMQNEVKSPKPGRVVTMAVREGAAVGVGEILAVVE